MERNRERAPISLLADPPPNLFGMGRMPSLLKGNYSKKPTPWPSGAPIPTTPTTDASYSCQKLENALAVECLVRQITEWDTQYTDFESSDAESDVLLSSEQEARRSPLTHAQVKLFDKSMSIKHRRYIERNVDIDSDDDAASEEEDINDSDFLELYRAHIKRKKMRKKIRANPDLILNGEKSSDVPKKKPKTKSPKVKKTKVVKLDLDELSKDSLFIDDQSFSKVVTTSSSKKKREKGEKSLSVDQLNTRRKRLWVGIIRKEIGKAHKSRNFNIREKLSNCKKVATQCMRAVRQKAMLSQRISKETQWRAKRLTREMQAYWKRFDRVERQQKRQQEKEAEEQQKMDVQLLEAKRQQRKLNFLITQTELYAHFIASKIGAKGFGENEDSILNKLDEKPAIGRLAEIDDYDCEIAKTLARNNAAQAMEAHQRLTKRYDIQTAAEDAPKIASGNTVDSEEKKEHAQPSLFRGTLKNYQLKGMNWLLNLYDQGINGILADEMGLGKTVQSLSMLAHIAEKYNIWGPFLVITPASTLHNWQQEVAKFLPSFKVVPYWGSPQERKILRHFWDQTNLHTRSASFHLVITSYQLVVTDFKYFNRIKWQYLVLDEAQAIKSSSSQRWKMLLEFKCRNRLLLSGTPIQNSMAELWSLLHFVMPTLFDSHEEFNDWFSKDIESSAENKSQIDEMQISRLHMILKPFMLRRIKKDVEHELTDKLEVLVYCPLTTRQKLLYMGLKRKIRIEDLLQGLGSQSQNSALASSLMNLVMQFRKVCNHPELFERREARSPFVMDIGPHLISKLIFHQKIHSCANSNKNHLLFNKLCIYNSLNVHQSLNPPSASTEYLEVSSSPFSFLRFVDTATSELFDLAFSLLKRWCHLAQQLKNMHRHLVYNKHFKNERTKFLGRRGLLFVRPRVSIVETPDLVFTRFDSECIYSHNDVTYKSMSETMEHRLIRTKHRISHHHHHHSKHSDLKGLYHNLVDEVPYVPRPDIIRPCQPTKLPKFLVAMCLRVSTPGRLPYCHDRSAAWQIQDHIACTNNEGLLAVKFGSSELAEEYSRTKSTLTRTLVAGGVLGSTPSLGWSNIIVPDKETLVFDAGKLFVLDGLLARLKSEGHRVLIYSQMTRMIDLLEEYMVHRKHTFMRLDGSSKIHERRDMVADFQERSDIFVFLLSTRAGGLGINLTAADTVIFYDSDWNPTVDQQAMDRAHRLGQTKQVTVYRLICKGTIEERILQRAKEKSAIQQMVIQGGSFKGKGGDLKPKEVVSLLLDDEEIEKRYKEQQQQIQDKDRKRKRPATEASTPCSESSSSKLSAIQLSAIQLSKKLKLVKEEYSSNLSLEDDSLLNLEEDFLVDEKVLSEDESLTTVDIEGGSDSAMSREPTRPGSPLFDFLGEKLGPKRCRARTGGKRGRPRGALKPGHLRENSSPNESTQTFAQTGSSPCSKRGPGRPRIKAGGSGGPLHQGNRGPPTNQPKVNRGLLQA